MKSSSLALLALALAAGVGLWFQGTRRAHAAAEAARQAELDALLAVAERGAAPVELDDVDAAESRPPPPRPFPMPGKPRSPS